MIEELKTFMAVVEFKNFTKASHHLNISQPSVSNHIKNLERYFNTKIIDRSIKQKKIIVTENGELLYKRAKEILNILEITKKEFEDSSEDIKGHLKIGASLTIGEYILPKFLSEFTKKYPNIHIELLIKNTKSICSKVYNLSLDVGLIEGHISSPSLIQDYFYEDKMVLALPYNSPINEDNFNIDKLQNLTWIEREEGSGTREYLDIFLNNNKIHPKNFMIFGSNYALKEAVKNDLGVTLISRLIAYPSWLNKEIKIISIDDNFKRNFSYIISNNITPSRASNLFIKELKEFSSTLE